MSLKYERVRKADLLLPVPLRWLTRAFSSITMAVVLLSLIVVYGTVASVPIGLLAQAVIYLAVALVVLTPALWLTYHVLFIRAGWSRDLPWSTRGFLAAAALLAGLGLSAWCWSHAADWAYAHPWFFRHRATVIYRLPFFEMTELEFYGWWPMKLILGLFVVNMIWATIRRIEFKFLNMGVLMVHTGIVTIALGSIFYGAFKLEGDTLLWRQDLGGQPVNVFYDGTEPAIYFRRGAQNLMIELPELPRYNDYVDVAGPGAPRLEIPLRDREGFQQVLGPNLRATIRGFVAYGQLRNSWIEAENPGPTTPVNPGLVLAVGDENKPDPEDEPWTLLAMVPAQRVIDEQAWALEYLHDPSPQRVTELMEPTVAKHVLIVEVPGQSFRQAYAIQQEQQIVVGDTGYTLNIQEIGDYGLAIVTPGYRGARDTRATVQVTRGERQFRRIAMFRYPELTQDFVPAPDDPHVGPMGKRQAPSDDIRLTYIDNSKPQFHLVTFAGDASKTYLVVRLPGREPFGGFLDGPAFPIGQDDGRQYWLHITGRMRHATATVQPRITPKDRRLPKDEGTYLHALLPVDLELDRPGQEPWTRRVWLAHMRYPDPELAEGHNRPVTVEVPTLGPITLTFSRRRIALPFAVALAGFEMKPYPGSRIPADFIADLVISDPAGHTFTGQARLNSPLLYHGFKLSQTGWDPGNPRDPNNEARNDQGRYIRQQRFSILGVGNNVGIHVIFVGGCLIVLGIPWAFYVKPALVQHRKRQLQREYANPQAGLNRPDSSPPPHGSPAP